jgi:hypothetical protein
MNVCVLPTNVRVLPMNVELQDINVFPTLITDPGSHITAQQGNKVGLLADSKFLMVHQRRSYRVKFSRQGSELS